MHHQRCQNRKQDDIASQFGDRFKCVHDGSIDHMAERMAEYPRGQWHHDSPAGGSDGKSAK